ncbi:NAD(P)H-hydrate dehydratase [Candidatus Enterovibrio altilux]|uniref:NAD(P)H-hydrate dehydratase n=1 Tax=Candidatus Enterovibrio altilux TaxID=1927128 RepID=UPI0012380DCC|nr:NAD(P)H-hydrate dehydratase [Candidatus Enterovibrio luxaltus]
MMSNLPPMLYRSAQVRDGERKIIEELGVSMHILMERAGFVAYQLLRKRWPEATCILVCCGGGNNGGDGYVIAKLAKKNGLRVQLYSVVDLCLLRGDVLAAKMAFEQAGGHVDSMLNINDPPDVVVDAIFGTGLNRSIKGSFEKTINVVNALNVPCLSIDVPSGLCADTGNVFGNAIVADVTICFVALKQGLFTGKAADYTGDIIFNGLGINDVFTFKTSASATLLQSNQAKFLNPIQSRSSNKGAMGRLLCIGGQKGMGGAILLCGQAALRSGAGLVSLLTSESNLIGILVRQPELMTCFWKRSQGTEALERMLMWADTIALGPGLGRSCWARQLFNSALATKLPMVLDADALHFLAKYPHRYENWVLTPHPGEAAKLLNVCVHTIEQDRFTAIKELQNRYGGVVVLKGAGTIVYDGNIFTVIRAGNLGMASGGMGDVLAGVIAALIFQTKHIAHAAIFGTFLHSHAADIVVEQSGVRGLIASDLLPVLGKNIEQMSNCEKITPKQKSSEKHG